MNGFDHLVHAVRDLKAAADVYERLGFRLTPLGQHPFGTANRLIQLQGNFIEILSVTRPEDIPATDAAAFNFGGYTEAFIKKREGLAMLALSSQGWRADRARFAQEGLDLHTPFGFTRDAKGPGGEAVELDFQLTFVADPRLPESQFFTCDHRHGDDAFWKPDFQTHPNTAVTLAEVVMVAADPASHAQFFGKLFGTPAVALDRDVLEVRTDGARVTVMTPKMFWQRYAGLRFKSAPEHPHFTACRITVEDLDELETGLSSRGVTYHACKGGLWVPPAQALGVLIEFTAAAS